MGMFLNPDNSAFQAVLNAKIYVDKSGLLNYTNSVLASTDAFICKMCIRDRYWEIRIQIHFVILFF